jgi:hypothetical protein
MTTIVSIMMLAAFALVAGAISLWRRGASRLQIALMLVVALVIVANVAIWIVPVGENTPLMQQVPR